MISKQLIKELIEKKKIFKVTELYVSTTVDLADIKDKDLLSFVDKFLSDKVSEELYKVLHDKDMPLIPYISNTYASTSDPNTYELEYRKTVELFTLVNDDEENCRPIS